MRHLALVALLAVLCPVMHAEEGDGPGVNGGDDRNHERDREGDRPDHPDHPDRPDRPDHEKPDRPDGGLIFTRADADKNGSISEKEFMHVLKAIAERRGDDRKGPGGRGVGHGEKPEHNGERAKELFAKADKDNSGELSREEFLAAMKHIMHSPGRPGQGGGGDRPRPGFERGKAR